MRWIHEELFQPVILVIGTETAKETLRESNGLSLAELFSPFGGHEQAMPTSYSILDHHYTVSNIKM